MYSDSNRIISFSTILIVCIFAWIAQEGLLLNTDVSWLMTAAKRLIKGGSYTNDFFETNPPLIIYLYTPLLFLQSLLHINEILALRIYIYLISAVSMFYCYILLKEIITENDKLLIFILMATLCSLFLIIPVSEFGQREHISLLLITPYILLTGVKCQHRSISSLTEIVIGMMAGIGFALKFYFYLPLFMIEIYYLYTRKSFSAHLRREMIIIYLVGFNYFTIILLFNYDYISTIIPLIMHMYYPKYQKDLWVLLLNDQSIYGYFLILFYVIRYQYTSYKQLSTLLLITAIGFWVVFLWQKTGWLYHALPFFTYDLLLYALLFSTMIMQKSMTKTEMFLTVIFCIFLLYNYNTHMSYIFFSIENYPVMVFLLLIILFSILLFISYNQSNKTKVFIAILVTIVINVVFYNYLSITLLRKYQLSLLICMLFLNLLLFLPKTKCYYGFLASVGMLIFIYPFYKTADTLRYSQYYKNLYQHMITDIKPYSKEKVYFFTKASEVVFPLIDYAKLNYVSRFWSMVWLPGMNNPQELNTYQAFYKSHQKDLDFYINTILSDFRRHNPTIVFVDIRKQGYFFNIPPDYIMLFSYNDSFKNCFRDYHLLEVIDFPPLYKFAVYSKLSHMN